MGGTVFALRDVGGRDVALVGGKGANLGELSRIDGLQVPQGFCVSTEVFDRVVGASSALVEALERLSRLKVEEREALEERAAALRELIEGLAIPADVEQAITRQLRQLGEHDACAVRSSATAEDSPGASFAGQHDTYLNIVGAPAILQHIRRCWASLFSDRAVAYRLQQGFDPRKVHMAVVVQKMLLPQAAGVLFTADPVSSSRRIVSIDACFGLGEALVSGRVSADNYQVRDGQLIAKTIASKQRATRALPHGGTEERALEPEQQRRQVLLDEQILQLARLGRQIEAHFGQPQDVEWCLVEDELYVVQSRPITTLYPIPEAGEPGNHVYVSVGHQQMMTDAMKPLGLSLHQLAAGRPMYAAGGRLFVDVAKQLATQAGRDLLLKVLRGYDPLLEDALLTILQRGDLIESPPVEPAGAAAGKSPPAHPGFQSQIEADPAIVPELMARSQASIAALKRDIRDQSGIELLDFIEHDVQLMKGSWLEPRNFGAIMAGMNAATWLNEHMLEWLGEKNAADALAQSVPNNVTAEMGLELLDVADVLRPHPEVVAYLQRAKDDGFLAGLAQLSGGPAAREALAAYLEKYGMRCPGEIDVTRTRWHEAPTALVPALLANIRSFAPGESRRRLERGLQLAAKKERELLERLKQLPDGEQKASETSRTIQRLRMFMGYREYPKYGIASRYSLYRQALLAEADRLVQAGVLREREDLYYLTFQELRRVVSERELDRALVRQRQAEHEYHRRLRPPRIITSDGEIFTGAYRRGDLPAGALAGLAVSAGVVEGRARVLSSMAGAELEAGDILVTACTDPGWTPVFVAIAGLVTEVGGLMTHGAVIAREYGLPAVVGVENATRSIRDGQRIRVHGGEGYVELLER